jgi:hypothetical protein
MNSPNKSVLAAIQSNKAPPSRDKLEEIVAIADLARQTELEIADLKERLAIKQKELSALLFEELPNLMDQAGVNPIGIPARGNQPSRLLELQPYYHANIAASWPQPKREAAFNALIDAGHEDLIKTEITITLTKGEHDKANKIVRLVKDQFGAETDISESVAWGTLTAWLKEQIQGGHPLPPLDVIGATVGRKVFIKKGD